MYTILLIIGIFLFAGVLPIFKKLRGYEWLKVFFALSILLSIVRVLIDPGGISVFTEIISISGILILLLLWFKNKTQLGFLVASIGLASNALVIFLNGGMPVSSDFSGVLPTGYFIANDQTVLAILSDWIPGLFWEEYASPGDYLLSSTFYVFWLQNRKNKPA